MSQRSRSYAWLGLVCLMLFVVGLVYMYTPGPEPEPGCKDDDVCILKDAGTDAIIHDASVKFFANPKNPLPDDCITNDSYTYDFLVEDGNIVLHSQLLLTDDNHSVADIRELAEVTMEAWQRKFDITDEAYLSFHDAVDNLHIIYTDTSESFDNVVGENTAMAFVATSNLTCFEAPNTPDFTMILSQNAHMKAIDPKGQYIIHELVHILAKVATGNTDSAHANFKLWIKHDSRRSVQAIALRLASEF